MVNRPGCRWERWFVACVYVGAVWGYDPPARWGQAHVIVNDALFVYGGKIDEFNQFGYTSAPNTNDILYLPLATDWSADTPPWTLVSTSSNISTSQGPALAWSSLSALNSHEVLHFGGIASPSSQDVGSAAILDVYNRVEPQWRLDDSDRLQITNQPPQRFRHSTTTLPTGQVIISGGEKPDGSQTCVEDTSIFDPVTLGFTSVPRSENSPPGLCGHASLPLTDGRVLFFGGFSSSLRSTPDLGTVYVLDTAQSPLKWTRLEVDAGSVPRGRRAFAAALIGPDKILVHGGSDPSFQTTYSDGWILDLSRSPAVWVEVPALSELGQRRDHFAVGQGNSVIFGFGWGTSEPASPGLQIFDTDKNTWVPSFTPSPPLITPTIPIPTQPSPSSSTETRIGSPSSPPTSTPSPHDPSEPQNPIPNDPTDPDNEKGDKRSKVTAIAVSTTVGLLALALGIIGLYCYRRHLHRRIWDERRFAPVAGDDLPDSPSAPHPYRQQQQYNDHTRELNSSNPFASPLDDSESLHLQQSIPRVSGFEAEGHTHRSLHGLAALPVLAGLAGIIRGAITIKSQNPREIPPRRNMLDDEDAHDFGGWYQYNKSRIDGSAGSSWSLMSFFNGGRKSREPSTSSRAQTPWREKGDPFADPSSAYGGYPRRGAGTSTWEEEALVGTSAPAGVGAVGGGARRPQGRRESSWISTRSGLSYASYTDPFGDPIHEHEELVPIVPSRTVYGEDVDAGVQVTGGDGEGRIRLVSPVAPLPGLQTSNLPLDAQGQPFVGHALSPLSERTSQSTLFERSQNTLPVISNSGSSDDHGDASRFSSRSRATSFTSGPSGHGESPGSPRLLSSTTSVFLAADRPDRRSSWWKRLSISRSRRSESGTDAGYGGGSGYMSYPSVALRDPNPPPRLVTIDEASSPGSSAGAGSKRSSPGMPPTPKAIPTEGATQAPLLTAAAKPSDNKGNDSKNPYEPRLYSAHAKSSSSLRTADTAYTDRIERMAGTMEVVQRIKTKSGSGEESVSDWRKSTDSSGDISLGRHPSTSSSREMVMSPVDMEPHESLIDTLASSPTTAAASFGAPASLPVVPPRTVSPSRVPPISIYNRTSPAASKSPASPVSHSKSPVSPASPGGSVAARIQEFEHRYDNGSKDKRVSVNYGLAPRRSLFVANPDHRRSQSSFESS